MADNPPIYLIDTCSLTHINEHPNPNVAWAAVIELIEVGRLKTVPQVMDELKNVDPATYARLNVYRSQFVTRISPDRLTEAGRINETYRKMSRPWHSNDSADPWLVGSARLEGYTIVTDELPKGGRMPTVCEKEGIPWMDLEGLVEAEPPGE